ncbi:MAG: LOG family protein [Nitrospinae bacterium]|nr:LOG family protein [Nitrospinota bacterium]
MGKKKRLISVFGSSKIQDNLYEYKEAKRLGKLLGRNGYDICTGGYDGLMSAVSEGGKLGGARVMGITMEIFDLPPNKWLDEEIKVKNFFPRLELLLEKVDGYVALAAGLGTMAEALLAWSMLSIDAIKPKPLILMGDFWREIMDLFEKRLYINPEGSLEKAEIVSTPSEVIKRLNRFKWED